MRRDATISATKQRKSCNGKKNNVRAVLMKNLYRIYQTTLCGPRLILGDVCLLMDLWEKMHQVLAGGFPH